MKHRMLLFLLILASNIFYSTYSAYLNQIQYKIRQVINYQAAFSDASNVTLVFTSCGALLDLRQSVLSFFYYNTYPLRKMVLVDRCNTPQLDLRNSLPQRNIEQRRYFQVISFGGTQIQSFQKAYQRVETKYIVNYQNKFITFKGFGFIEEAIDAIQYGEKNNIKISQVTSLFPLWKNYRYLSNYVRTPSGTQFYQIRSFKPSQRYYFTFNPSVINFQVFYKRILHQNMNQFCIEHCKDIRARDCCELEIGKMLFEVNRYIQVFVDSGSVQANVFSVP